MKELKEYIVNENNFFKNLGVGQKTLIKKWIEENCKLVLDTSYTINDDMTIDVDDSIIIDGYDKKELPDYIQFNKVNVMFIIRNSNKLETLKGCPKECKDFNCSGCKKLKNLKDSPQSYEILNCSNCDSLETLDGISETCKILKCKECNKLENLLGIKSEYMHTVNCDNCKKLESLEGLPLKLHHLHCNNCEKLMTLEYCPEDLVSLSCKGCGGNFTQEYLTRNNIYVYRTEVDKKTKLKR